MRESRFPGRALIFLSLLLRLPFQWRRCKPQPAKVSRILILHQFLLGDALMATSLLAKAREQYPLADIVMACPPGQAALYAGQPYGVRAFGWHIRNFASICQLFAMPRFDLVLLMGENRLSYLARAIGARWIVGFAGEQPAHKNWLLDEAVPYAQEPEAWTDTAACLIEGPEPRPYRVEDWPMPPQSLPDLPDNYIVLHVGASSATRFWPAAHWQVLADAIRAAQLSVVWSCGPGEDALLREIDPPACDVRMAGCLSLLQLRQLLAGARACVCPDTGVAHLAKVAGTPLLMLFGPGSEVLFGASRFFAHYHCLGVGPAIFPCRNQRSVHHRDVDWALRCFRRFGNGANACRRALCMEAISATAAWQTLQQLLQISQTAGAAEGTDHD
ncbi:glycosyltransferase family 9 protein [Aquitalea sp. ASV15]|uniref:glycosyltransferase family 9 protein n=1 Tax=Aquitalea sp. ASV15 TaxID=2795104 RepID=UPI0018EBAB1B|nr:glycosyltransferase family 9 protein [Aquitalea sp. ASV15]